MSKKKEIYFGKGLKRIYFVLAGLWIAGGFWWLINGWFSFKDFVFMTATPIAIYFILLFFIKGFKK